MARSSACITRDAPLAPIMNPSQARYDPTKFNWLGSTTTETSVCISRGSSPVKTLADLMQKELIVGDTGAGTGTYVFPRALNGLFGTKFKIVSGFQNSVDVFLALERGEVDGICESLDSVSGKSPGWREKGVFNAVLHGGLEPDPHLKGVPFVFELAKTEEDRQALRFLYAGQAIGRPFAMPPDVPAARVAIMRKAFAGDHEGRGFSCGSRKDEARRRSRARRKARGHHPQSCRDAAQRDRPRGEIHALSAAASAQRTEQGQVPWRSAHILVVGETILDLTPLDGGAAFAPALGGSAFNTARALGALGAGVAFAGAISRDDMGRALPQRRSKRRSVDCALLRDCDAAHAAGARLARGRGGPALHALSSKARRTCARLRPMRCPMA